MSEHMCGYMSTCQFVWVCFRLSVSVSVSMSVWVSQFDWYVCLCLCVSMQRGEARGCSFSVGACSIWAQSPRDGAF